MKKLILGSVVAAALVFTGCGSDDDTPPAATPDTTAPVVNATATAQVDSTVTLATDNVGVASIVLSGAGAASFTTSGTTVTTPATAGNYIVHVLAKDAAGNEKEGDVNVTVTAAAAGTGITYGGLEWTPLIAADANDTISGRQSQADATTKCTDAGKRLPTLVELQTNATSLKPDLSFRGAAPDQLVVWSSTNLTGYYFNGTDANVTSDDDNYTEATWTVTTTNFYTCVQ